MAYETNEWKDRVVQRPKTYQMNNNDDGSVTLIESFGLVTELGTPVNADYMNHIEQGIAGCAIRYYSTTETFITNEVILNVNESGEVELWKSLTENNKNNPLTDTTKWEKVSLGGGGGLEVGDIGIAPLGIDESKGLRRYLNGSTMPINTNTLAFVNKLKSAVALYPSLACTEEEWQAIATASAVGQCGKFVIDESANTVRLPKIIMPIQGLTDLSKLGELVEAGLPNIEGVFTTYSSGSLRPTANGAFSTSVVLTSEMSTMTGNGDTQTTNIDASRSSSIYDNSDTVQQEQIQYPYFIQIATGVEYEVNITNEIELNNPYTLFDSKYTEAPLYNLSWLLSNGTYYAKSAYVTAYEALLVENNTKITAGENSQLTSGGTYVKRGLSVKLSTAEDITDYDFVINTTDETFRLPLKSKLASGNAVAGNGLSLGLTDGTGNYGARNGTDGTNAYVTSVANAYGVNTGTTLGDSTAPTGTVSLGVTEDQTKSGIETSTNGLSLYFYVGETVQNINLINAAEIVTNKADVNLSNVSSAGKETAVSWGMPDYDSAITISTFPYTAPTDGFVTIIGHIGNSTTYITVNDKWVAIGTCTIVNYPSGGASLNTGLFVSKGDIVKYYNGEHVPISNFQAALFMPLKGVSNA